MKRRTGSETNKGHKNSQETPPPQLIYKRACFTLLLFDSSPSCCSFLSQMIAFLVLEDAGHT